MSTVDHEKQAAEWSRKLNGATAGYILEWAASTFSGRLTFASSFGVEDQVLTDLIVRKIPKTPIFTLDTGRMFPETYDLQSWTEHHYSIRIRILYPESADVERLVNEHGIDCYRNSMELRKACCRARKILPLRRALEGQNAWICGLRREQSVTRCTIDVVEWDSGNGLFKINPLVDWTEQQVWDYVKVHSVPYHPLHDKGFPSIGCSCCTRAVAPGEDARAGRWWWESPEHKECGLHNRKGFAGE